MSYSCGTFFTVVAAVEVVVIIDLSEKLDKIGPGSEKFEFFFQIQLISAVKLYFLPHNTDSGIVKYPKSALALDKLMSDNFHFFSKALHSSTEEVKPLPVWPPKAKIFRPLSVDNSATPKFFLGILRSAGTPRTPLQPRSSPRPRYPIQAIQIK